MRVRVTGSDRRKLRTAVATVGVDLCYGGGDDCDGDDCGHGHGGDGAI